MELLQGNTLAGYLHEHGPMTRGQAPLIGQMVSALSAAHQLGIVYRDFKPGNVMLIEDAGQKYFTRGTRYFLMIQPIRPSS